MAAENSFQFRLNDMENVGVSSIFKRKRLEPPMSALPAEGHSRESLLLGPVEKRMKSAQWSPNSSFPRAVYASSIGQWSTHSVRRSFMYNISREAGKSSSNDFGMLGATRRLARGSLNSSAIVSGKSIYTSNRGDVRVFPRMRSRENHSDLVRPAYPHYPRGHAEGSVYITPAHLQNLQGNGEDYETGSRALARDLKGEESVEQYTKLLGRATVTNATHGRVNGRYRDIHAEFTRDDTSQASLLDAGERSESQTQWQNLYSIANEKNDSVRARQAEIDSLAATLQGLRVSRPILEKKPAEDPKLVDAFTPLSSEAEHRVNEVLEGFDRNAVLVLHEKSNIEVTTTVMQCLRPQAWLNDEVINVYMELLKEREARAPDFPKCHFFNTFFYNKLYKDKRLYDYKAIRRWTTSRKLGYSLSACDKILVPIHQDIHWCLAVINIRDKKLEYLDSLKGADRDVLEVLARYISDEAKDKDNKNLETSNWDLEYPRSIPEQQNGCDCGMFMLKYADFHARDAPLQFTQEDMPYFRKRTVWEILNLKAT